MPDILPILISIIRRYQINQIVYIYDDINGAYRLKQLMNIQTSDKIQYFNIISRYIDNLDDLYDLLHNIELMTNPLIRSTSSSSNSNQKFNSGRYIILDFHSFNTYRIIMDKIKQRGMTTSDYHYILLTLNAKELDMTYFRYGGVNVTFFVLPSYDNNKTYLNLLKEKNLLSIQSLLLTDAWELLIRTINHMIISIDNKQKIFYDNITSKIDCQKNFIQPWLLGNNYLEYLMNISFQGLTGYVQFSNITGERINYTFDVYRVTRNNMPKKIGFFRAPNILQVKLNR